VRVAGPWVYVRAFSLGNTEGMGRSEVGSVYMPCHRSDVTVSGLDDIVGVEVLRLFSVEHKT
jgi:hypothetical protein